MKLYREKTPAGAIDKAVEIAGSLGSDITKRVYLFCESRATLSYELKFCEKFGGTFNTEITSFSRYVFLSGKVKNYLNKSASTMIVRKIIEENSAFLTRFKRGSANLAVSVYNLISQLKAAKVTVEQLKDIVAMQNGAFKNKLADVTFIYEQYENYLKSGEYSDESAYLLQMPDILRQDENVRGATVIVSDVGNLTKKTVDVLLTLEKLADLHVVTVSADAKAYENGVYDKCLSLFSDIEVFDGEPLSPQKEAILSGMFSFVDKPYRGDNSNVKLFEHPDAISEAQAVARRIRYEVVNNGARYMDFVIASGKVEAYAPIFERVFADYDIPLFVDEKKTLKNHPLVNLFSDLILAKTTNFKPNYVLSLAKNRLLFSESETQSFESYLHETSVSRRMLKREFTDPTSESVRKQIVELVGSIPSKSTVNEYIALFSDIFERYDVNKKSEDISGELAHFGQAELSEYNRLAAAAFLDALSETASVLGDYPVTLELFSSLVDSAIGSCSVSVIATGYDSVFFGDTVTAGQRLAKTLFAVGFDFSVPDVKSDVALLCDDELLRLDGYKCVVEPTVKVVNQRERQNVLTTLLSYEKNLIVSYSLLTPSGERALKSDVITYLENILDLKVKKPHLTNERSDEYSYLAPVPAVYDALLSFERFSDSEQADLTYPRALVDVLKDTADENSKYLSDYLSGRENLPEQSGLYNGGISASLIETYFSCPYKAFAQYVLKLKESTDGDVAFNEVGIIYHYVFENFAKQMDVATPEQIDRAADELFDKAIVEFKYSRYLNKKKYEYLFSMMKTELRSACKRLYDDYKNSDFRLMGTEVKFNDYSGSGFGAIRINTARGEKRVNGAIDRIDSFGDYIRIIDYKTGAADNKISYEKFFTGQNIQLYLYMNAIESANKKLAGVHYLSVTDKYGSNGESGFNYYGKTLADYEVVGHLDKNFLRTGKSEAYGVSVKKSGEFNARSKVLDKDSLADFVKYAKLVTESGANEIYDGFFKPSPYTEDACEYCKLKGMCGYDCSVGSRTRRVDQVDEALITKAVKGEQDE